jgi:hypothetical protein
VDLLTETEKRESTRWVAGLPLAGERELTEGERAELLRRAAPRRLFGWASYLAFPLLFFLFLAGMALATDVSGRPAGTAAVVVMLLMLASVPLLVVAGRDARYWGMTLPRDARQGTVHRYEGQVEQIRGADETIARLWSWKLLPPDLGTLTLEVLPHSGLLWRVNEQPVRRWVRLTATEVADVPEFAGVAAQWLDPVELPVGGTVHVGQRELSAGEQWEIERHARQLKLRPLIPAVLLTLWAGPVLWACLATGRWPTGHDAGSFGLLVLLTATADLMLVKCLGRARKMGQDILVGRVVIVRDGAPAESVTEILPVSRIAWTIDGRPASWRTAPDPHMNLRS